MFTTSLKRSFSTIWRTIFICQPMWNLIYSLVRFAMQILRNGFSKSMKSLFRNPNLYIRFIFAMTTSNDLVMVKLWYPDLMYITIESFYFNHLRPLLQIRLSVWVSLYVNIHVGIYIKTQNVVSIWNFQLHFSSTILLS